MRTTSTGLAGVAGQPAPKPPTKEGPSASEIHHEVVASGTHFFAQLGLRDVAVEGVELAIELPLRPQIANPRGGLQGGLLATLVDVVGGRMAMEGCPPGLIATTTDLTIHYLAPVAVGPAQARGRVLRRGRRSVVLQVDIHDAGAERLAAVGTVSFALVDLGDR